MAIRKAVTNGNWSNVATWDGGTTLPGAGDDVYFNSFAVQANQDITVQSISNAASTGISDGGNLVISSARTVTANINGGATNYTVYVGTSQPVTLIGDIQAGAYYCVLCDSNGTVDVTGNVYGGAGGYGIYFNQAGILNITGNCYPGSGAPGVYFASAATVNVTGNSYGANSGTNVGVFTGGTGSVNVFGSAIAGATSSGIRNITGLGSIVAVEGLELHSNGTQGVEGRVLFINASTPTSKIYRVNGSSVVLQDVSDVSGAIPDDADVRDGVLFNYGANEGTLKVPPKASVSLGVPVDDDFGEAVLTPEDFLEAINSSSNAIAERLRNCSTVQTTASQLAAAL
jgi:hypothetical protein